MKYYSSAASDMQSLSKGVVIEQHEFEKRAAVASTDVFLSHSSADRTVLPNVIGFLKQYNVNVYIDKGDKELPQKTSMQTGVKLKERITQCRKFIVLVTTNSKNSRWIPWELGIADEKKKIPNVALLPDVLSSTTVDWPEQEYLGLYPRIVLENFTGQQKPVWMVLDHHVNRGVELGEWLKRPN